MQGEPRVGNRATFSDREKAVAAGKIGGAGRRREAKRRREDPLYNAKKALPGLMDELLKAAKGQGDWKGLTQRERLTALLKAIEYGVGRPTTVDKQGPKDVQSEGDGVEAAGLLAIE
ncbi:MAG TPA: hypothetical protein VJA25_13030 [Dehalococcoidia bacterium]|nr:hypothetical protein [Dehalococcoidia bacterium]